MNEEEYWVTVTSSEDETRDSDEIDSDIEAELYSAIHHEAASARTSANLSNAQVTVASPSHPTPNKSQFMKHGSVDSDASKGLETLVVVEEYNNINVKSNASVGDLYTGFKTPEVIVTKDLSNMNAKRKSDVSVVDLCTSFDSPDLKVIKDHSNVNAKRNFDVSVVDLCTSFDSPEVKVIKDCSNTNAKRKSDVSISDESEGNVDGIPRKKHKLASGERESERMSALNGSDTSDSDSIIWSEADDCDINLQTNVEPEVVALDSDSFSDESYEPFDEISSFRRSSESSSQPSTSNSSNGIDPWHINSDDLYRSKGRSNSNRYHERAVLKCTNCNLKGHTVKFCTVSKNVKCYVCGGSHTGMGCSHKVCSRCFQKGHDSRFCRQRFVDLCLLCRMRGHSVKYCPDLWRRYHLTTNQGNIVIANPVPQDSPIYCFNCGEQGHYGAECRLLRPDRNNNFQTWTSVIAHVHPSDTIKRVMGVQSNTASGRIPNFPTYEHRMPLPPVFPGFPTPTQKKKKRKKIFNANDNLQTKRRPKKKKNKAISASQTPPNIVKTTNSKEFNFPRTPKSERKKFKRGKKIEKESFMNGLHRRLGLNPGTGLPNDGFM